MPRKQNGWGNSKSFAFKGIDTKTDRSKKKGAAGYYPSDRRFGSTVTRTAIEQFDLDSDWSRWRKGIEYYSQAAYLSFEDSNAILYQGTDYEVPLTFKGYRFATKNADSRSHYVIIRSITENRELGTITEIHNNPYDYSTNQANRELWVKVQADNAMVSDKILVRSVGERLTDSEASASVKWVLTDNKRPASYLGKSKAKSVSVTVTVPLSEVLATTFIQNNSGNTGSLVGKSCYMPDFYEERNITNLDVFTDEVDSWNVSPNELITGKKLQILDTNTTYPPTLGQVSDLTPIYSTNSFSSAKLNGEFVFEKNKYQRFFGAQYLTADLVKSESQSLAYSVMPFTILSVLEDTVNNTLSITSEPFQSTLELFTAPAINRYIIFNDNSFTLQAVDNNSDGIYNHPLEVPGVNLWQKLNINIDPWMDQTFISGRTLKFADLYTCSCPSYLHAKIRSPEVFDDTGGTLNRQTRAPIPTAKSPTSFESTGLQQTAGIAESWATSTYKKGFKICKHSIASMFINKIRVQEPNTFPSYNTRLKFEEKLAQDISEVAAEFRSQLERSEITTVEIVFALAEALNLNDVEIGFVLLTSSH